MSSVRITRVAPAHKVRKISFVLVGKWFAPVAEVEYAFCARCGSSLFWREADGATQLTICAGTLDPPTGLRTTTAWWIDEASDYHPRPDVPEHASE